MDLLRKQPGLRVPEIAQTLGVSEGTVRNDLNALEDDGHLIRVHGGAVLKDVGHPTSAAFGIRHQEHTVEKNLIGRVAFVLLYFYRDIYNSRVFDLPVSRKEIADYIGMSTANVIRTLSDFKKDGIIKVFGKTIEIVDVNKLDILAKRG